jgi:hypothetical protein
VEDRWSSYGHRMAKGKGGMVLVAFVAAALLVGHPGGSTSSSSEGDEPAGSSGSSSPRSVDPPAPPVPGQREKDQEPAAVGLVADPVKDECVLNAAEVQALIGAPVDRTQMTSVPGPDGRPVRGCVAARGDNQLVLMNVYRVRGGSPTDAVRSADGADRRSLDGVGEAAVIVPARTGPALQVAGKRVLVTLEAGYLNPSDDAWRVAGRIAIDRAE